MIDSTYTVQVLQKLVRIPSVNPSLEENGAGELEIGKYILGLLNELGIDAVLEEIAPGRVNVTGILKGNGIGKSLMLNAHLDTVGISGMQDPFSGRIEGDKLYGRGSYDMKGGIAAMLGAAKALQNEHIHLNGDLVFTFVADEEYESIGSRAVAKKIKTNAAIVTEPTDLNICLAHRGFAIHQITTAGKTAHGGNHRLGIDANTKMGLLLAELAKLSDRIINEQKHPLCGEGSMHVPLIKGGRSLFVYSHECVIHTERRTLPGETNESVQQDLMQIISRIQNNDPDFKADLKEVMWRSPYEINQEAQIVSDVTGAALAVLGTTPSYIGHTWWEDSALFGEAGIETVILGPKGGGIHEDNEWVEKQSVIDLAEILFQTALHYCGKS